MATSKRTRRYGENAYRASAASAIPAARLDYLKRALLTGDPVVKILDTKV